jgi:hypothetical protein
MITKWEAVIFVVYYIFTFSPFLILIYAVVVGRVSITQEIDSSSISGSITASGVLTGFLTASILSKSEELEPHYYMLLVINLGIFFSVVNMIFVKHLFFVEKPTVADFTFVMTSINANAFAVIIISLRLFHHKIWKHRIYRLTLKVFQPHLHFLDFHGLFHSADL